MTFGKIEEYIDNEKFSTTAFDTKIVGNTETIFDLPSTYPFSTERYDLIQEGTVDEYF